MKPHLTVLGLLDSVYLNLGKTIISDCLIGEDTERIRSLNLNKNIYYSSLPLFQREDVFELIDILIKKKLIESVPLKGKPYIKTLQITKKGKEEIKEQRLDIDLKKNFKGYYSNIEKVENDDIKIFERLGNVLDGLSDEQKKAVVHDSKKILCVAGAGSGKTRVLTRRAWFLSKYRTVPEEMILAVTFTRKARQEMRERLEILIPNNKIRIETFNSFCEKILKENESKIYSLPVKVMTYKEKIKIIQDSLIKQNIRVEELLKRYYSKRQRNSKDSRTLFLGFINDIFSVLDYKRNNYLTTEDIEKLLNKHEDMYVSDVVKKILKDISSFKEKNGLRDFTDQIVHTLDFLKRYDAPVFDHILIDEYQDINSLQFELIQLLNPKNLFCVGDPRQAIYGWRSAILDYILNFEEYFPGGSILELTNNYRSSKEIVDLGNIVIKKMGLSNLVSKNGEDKDSIKLVELPNEQSEIDFIVDSINVLDVSKKDIFVLARTNRQIEDLAAALDRKNIRYLKRTIEETKANVDPEENQITISTIHAIKGLEADVVYILGASSKNHPIKAGDHPLIDSIKINDTYEKIEEELRLFYVAVTRARKKLIISYSGIITPYLTNGESKIKSQNEKVSGSSNVYNALRQWRYETSTQLGVPAYQVFSNNTLEDLCEVLPVSLSELRQVSGFGSFKIRRWGEDIIKIIKNSA